jgi:hypothetical protein
VYIQHRVLFWFVVVVLVVLDLAVATMLIHPLQLAIVVLVNIAIVIFHMRVVATIRTILLGTPTQGPVQERVLAFKQSLDGVHCRTDDDYFLACFFVAGWLAGSSSPWLLGGWVLSMVSPDRTPRTNDSYFFIFERQPRSIDRCFNNQHGRCDDEELLTPPVRSTTTIDGFVLVFSDGKDAKSPGAVFFDWFFVVDKTNAIESTNAHLPARVRRRPIIL